MTLNEWESMPELPDRYHFVVRMDSYRGDRIVLSLFEGSGPAVAQATRSTDAFRDEWELTKWVRETAWNLWRGVQHDASIHQWLENKAWL